jgi:hypothetical protein
MKYLRLVLLLSLVAFISTFSIASAATYDSEQATFQKGGAHTAKVQLGSKTYSAPISFGDGASWTSVKDHYELDPSVVSGIKAGKLAISIGSDGGASFTKKK